MPLSEYEYELLEILHVMKYLMRYLGFNAWVRRGITNVCSASIVS